MVANDLENQIHTLQDDMKAMNRPNIGQEKNPSDPEEINLFMAVLRNSNGGITNSQDYNSKIAKMRGQDFVRGSLLKKVPMARSRSWCRSVEYESHKL